jgi:hypothetical protein
MQDRGIRGGYPVLIYRILESCLEVDVDEEDSLLMYHVLRDSFVLKAFTGVKCYRESRLVLTTGI